MSHFPRLTGEELEDCVDEDGDGRLLGGGIIPRLAWMCL